MDVLRERKIVNAGDLLRFEMEGLSAPACRRTSACSATTIWFEPLPRTTTGKLKRHEIVRRLKLTPGRRRAAGRSGRPRTPTWLDDPHVSAALAVVTRRATEGVSCRPDANLELDLGLDSMERVELLTELEQQFGGATFPRSRSHEIFTAAAS